MYGGDGFWVFADPTDPTYVYAECQGGNIVRVNRKTHEIADIKPLARLQGERKLRFNWNTPIHMSPTQKGTLYIGAQFLFRSRDHGADLGAHLARPHHQRPGEAEAGAVGRPHGRQLHGREPHARSSRSPSRRRTRT